MNQALFFIWLLMGHFIFDWLLQTHWMAMNKSKDQLPLFVHSLIYALGLYGTAAAYLHYFPSFFIFLVLFVSHVLLDDYKFHLWWMTHIKRIPAQQAQQSLWMIICIDQIWHIIILFCILYIAV